MSTYPHRLLTVMFLSYDQQADTYNILLGPNYRLDHHDNLYHMPTAVGHIGFCVHEQNYAFMSSSEK
jgi:hypothetical protein